MNEEARYLEQYCPVLARQCDEMAEAGAELARVKRGLHRKTQEPAGGERAVHGGQNQCESGKAIDPDSCGPYCIACGKIKPFAFGVSRNGALLFGICGDCDEDIEQSHQAVLFAVAHGMNMEERKQTEERQAMAMEIARLSEALRVGEENKAGIGGCWDAAANSGTKEIERLKRVCRRQFRWNVVLGVGLALGLIWNWVR